MKILKIIFWIFLIFIVLWVSRHWLLPAIDNFIFQLLPNKYTGNQKPVPENQEACVANGGDWGRAGLAPKETCRFAAEDAGKFCLAGFQCQLGKCIGKLSLRNPAVFSTGVCARYPVTFGCSQEIHFGLTNKAICRD